LYFRGLGAAVNHHSVAASVHNCSWIFDMYTAHCIGFRSFEST